MKNPAPYLRKTLFSLLNGQVTVPGDTALVKVFENEGDEGERMQILIKDYSDGDSSNKENFRSAGNQVIEIVCVQADATRKNVDLIGNDVMKLIKPTVKDAEVLSGDDFQVIVKGKPSINHLTEDGGSGEKIVRLILRYNLTIIER